MEAPKYPCIDCFHRGELCKVDCGDYQDYLEAEDNYKKACEVVEETIEKEGKRTKTLLVVRSLEVLKPQEEGVELNVGYEFDVDGPLPEVADGIAKMAKELDKIQGENAGAYFIELIRQFYENA